MIIGQGRISQLLISLILIDGSLVSIITKLSLHQLKLLQLLKQQKTMIDQAACLYTCTSPSAPEREVSGSITSRNRGLMQSYATGIGNIN